MVKVSFGLSLCWVECLWATWAASAVHVVNIVLKPSTLDMVGWVECLWAAWAAAAVHVVNMMLKAFTLDMVDERDSKYLGNG